MATPLAVQLYSVRDRLAQDRDSTLREIAGIGYGAVEPFRPTEDAAAGMRKVADDLGLRVCATHAVDLVRDGDPAEIFDAVHTLGTDLVIVPGGIPRDEFGSADGVKRVAETLNRLAELAASAGLRLGYHNHEHELEERVDGRHALDVLADLLSPDVFLEVDTYWAAVGHADVPDLLTRHGDRVRLLHVKDGPGIKGEPNVAVGSGSMPIPTFLAAAPTAWRVVEFDHCAGDVITELRTSYDYLRTLENS